jgi:hypothetical protein
MGRCPGSICSLTAEYIPATHLQALGVVLRMLHNLNTSVKTSGDLLLHRFINAPEQKRIQKKKIASISNRHYKPTDTSNSLFPFPVQ